MPRSMQVVQERIGVSISGQTTAIVVATRMWYQMVRGRAPMESIGCWLAEVRGGAEVALVDS